MLLKYIIGVFISHLLFAIYCIESEGRSIDSITSQDIEDALQRAREKISVRKKLEKKLTPEANYINPFVHSPEARHQLRFSGKALPVNPWQSVLEAATVDIVSRFGLNRDDVEKLSKIPLDGEIGRDVVLQCADNRTTNCDATSKYRTIDGSCNNLERPNEGRAFTCLSRILPPDYEDGVGAPRTQGNTLPQPRCLSVAIHRSSSSQARLDHYLTTWHMSCGQFITHDLEFTTQPTTEDNALISCCPNGSNNHQQCLPMVLCGDPDFSGNCMNFARDLPCTHCSMNQREQMNSLTSYLDCSQVYGTSAAEAQRLRTTNGNGKLLTRNIAGVGEMPPPSQNPETDQCSRPGFPCFLLGDFRANQNLLLLSSHIICMRFHNYVVDILSNMNPNWDGERKYQEARRIVIACFQHIVYNEYLPPTIGNDMMKSYGLHYPSTQYDSRENAAIINSFGTAAFRFGHSTVPDNLWTITEEGQQGSVQFEFFNPTLMYQPGMFENIVRGSTRQQQHYFDQYVARSVGVFLYRRLNVTNGLDLASINIHRGRDHGLPGYVAYVNTVLNTNVKSSNDLVNLGLVSQQCINSGLYEMYRDVRDIDLWTGLLCEPNTENAVVGLTARHIIAEQFFRIKYADRHFYTHQGQAGSFTPTQLAAIRNITYSRIICDVLKLPEMAQWVFSTRSDVFRCDDFRRIPQLNLMAWKE